MFSKLDLKSVAAGVAVGAAIAAGVGFVLKHYTNAKEATAFAKLNKIHDKAEVKSTDCPRKVSKEEWNKASLALLEEEKVQFVQGLPRCLTCVFCLFCSN